MAKIPEKIDVHSHFLSSVYREHCRANGHSAPDGFPVLPVGPLSLGGEVRCTLSHIAGMEHREAS